MLPWPTAAEIKRCNGTRLFFQMIERRDHFERIVFLTQYYSWMNDAVTIFEPNTIWMKGKRLKKAR